MAILEESCMASADMQWPFYSGEQIVAHGPLVLYYHHFDHQVHILEGHYKVIQRMKIVPINAIVYSYSFNQ